MLVQWKRDKSLSIKQQDEECWHVAQRLWSVKHEKRDKQNNTFLQFGKAEKTSDNLVRNLKTNCTRTKSNKIWFGKTMNKEPEKRRTKLKKA